MTGAAIAGLVLSCAGMAATVLSFLQRRKLVILIWQTAGTALFLVSYIFSEGGIAVALNAVYLVRNFLFMSPSLKGRRAYATSGVLCAVYAAVYAAWAGFSGATDAEKLWSLLPVAGAVFGTVAVACVSTVKLRLWKYGDSACWLAYNARLGWGALGGVLCEIFNTVSLTVGIIKTLYQRRKENGKI